MINLLAIPLMSVLARLSGGGLFAPKIPAFLPEALFALCIALASGYEHGWIWTLPALAVSYIAMQAGHGTVYNMKGWQSDDPDRIQSLEYVVRPIFKVFGWSIYTPAYSWAVMGLKGFLIGLPLLPFAPLLALLWPASYAIKNTELGEWLSGASAGLCIFLILVT